MSETRETVAKLKLELQEVRAAAGAQGAAKARAEEPPKEPHVPKSEIPGRARGRAARAVAGSARTSQLSFDLVGLGLKEADRTELAAAVQTTRAIIAEYA
jgi:type IV secretion system protein VirD4